MSQFGTRHQENLETRKAAESVIERLYLATKQLATSSGDVRKRLQAAVVTLLPLQAQEFPEELREDFRWVISESTKFQSGSEFRGDLEATMRRIRNSTGEKIAERIFHIYSRLQEIRGFPLLGWRDPGE